MTRRIDPELEERMNLYLDGRLSGAQRAEFERLIEADEGLREAVEFHRGLTLEFQEEAPPLPRGFAAGPAGAAAGGPPGPGGRHGVRDGTRRAPALVAARCHPDGARRRGGGPPGRCRHARLSAPEIAHGGAVAGRTAARTGGTAGEA
jgi:anti-sigma factor RsiW